MTITRIASQSGGAAAPNTTSVSKAFAGNVTTGDLVVVQAAKYTPSSDPFVVGDCTKSAGTATLGAISMDRQRAFTNAATNIYSVATFSAIVTGTGSCTMQVAGAVAGSYLIMSVQELGGSWDASRLVTGSDATGDLPTPGAPDSGSVASGSAAIFMASLATDSAVSITHTIDAAYTLNYEQEDGVNQQTGAFGDEIVSSNTTDSGSWTAPTTKAWVCMVVVYKEVATAGIPFFMQTDIMTGNMQVLNGGMQ